MAWRAIHPSMTKEVRVPADDPTAPTFTIGFWPPLESEKAKIYVSEFRKPADDKADDPILASRKARQDLQAFWAMARFGVRGWTGLGDLACSTETLHVEGREHEALTQEACEILYHSGLLVPLALECWKFNNLTETEKKTSSSPSSSSTSKTRTSAGDATPASGPVKNGAESYDSTAWSSTAAPMSSSTLRPGT